MKNQGIALAAVTLVALAACQNLPDVAANTCGNGVLETGEDCETSTLDDAGNQVGQCGAADGVNACFYECAEDGTDCPPGYGCGVDGRCRQPSGELTLGASLTLAADELLAGDVDGDGFDDLIAASGTSIEVDFGSAQADFASSVDTLVATPQQGVSIGDLNGDRNDDILIGTTPGIQTFLGHETRVLDPFSYPSAIIEPSASFAIGASFDVDDANPNDEVLLAWANQIGFPVISITARLTLPDPDGPVEGLASNLLGPLPWARLGANRATATPAATQDPTVEIAVGYGNSSQIFLLRASGSPLAIASANTVLDAGVLLSTASGMFFGYFDGDDCVDLLVHGGVAVGRLVLFRNTAAGALCTGIFQAPQDVGTMPTTTRLLGVADFTGDGVSDLITDTDVLFVSGTGPWTVTSVASAGGSPYDGVQVVDLNGDGALDLAAFRESQPDVDVLINAGTVFNRFVIATPDPVQRLGAGDFDGDLTRDLAIVELDSSGDEPVYSVSVSFGQFHGPPGARVVMDRFDLVNGMVAASVVSATGELDAVDDLVVFENNADEGNLDATILFGSGARGMTSPLILPSGAARPQSPDAFVVAPLDTTAGLDLFAIGDGGTAYLFTGEGSGELALAGSAPWPAAVDIDDTEWTTGDIDGDGHAEVAVADRRSGLNLAGPIRVLLFTPDPTALPTDPQLGLVDGFAGAHAIRITDLDGDGDNDLLVAFDPVADVSGSVQIGWNHDGVIDSLVELSSADGCIDAVPVALDADPQPELVALCRNPDPSPGQNDAFVLRRFDALEPDTLGVSEKPLAGSSGGRSTQLLAADVNGDGLDDVVVSTKGDQAASVRIFLQNDIHANP